MMSTNISIKRCWSRGGKATLVTWLGLVTVIGFNIIATIPAADGKKCPGKCIYNATDCKIQGGKIAGYCTNELACCDYSYKKIGSCGANMSKLNTAMFRSPEYPEYHHGDLVCQFDFTLSSNATGIIVEFSDILMDGRGFVKHSSCESDMFFFKGFPDWTPPAQCGNLSNYAAVIDLESPSTKGMKTFTILALMSSNKYKWNIKVTQLYKADPYKSQTPKKRPGSKPTTESPAREKEGENDDEETSTEQDSPYGRPEKIIKQDRDSKEEEERESEEEEMFRIMNLVSKLKVPRMGDSTLMMVDNGDEDGASQYYGFPEEETFIVNGDDTEIAAVPWQASLRTVVSPRLAKLLPQLKLKNCTIDEGIHFCGGSIISDRHILSATHCFLVGEKLSTWQRTSTMKVVLGDSNTCDENKNGVQEFNVDKVYYHYAYDTSAIIHDVVVIKLAKKIKFTSKIQMIKMAETGMNFEHKVALASGWGLTNLTAAEGKSKTPEQLQSANDMFIGNSSYCMAQQMRLYPKIKSQSLIKFPKYKDVFSSLICTYIRNGTVARVVGQGDSGGPLVVNTNSSFGESSSENVEPLLIGVISYMIPIPHEEKAHDVSNYIDFYQSVPYFRKWIDLAMQ